MAATRAPMGLLLLALSQTAGAVKVCYTEGGDATPLALINNAVINNGELQVTADANGQSGAIWSSESAGADGVAFVMQNQSASTIGASGGGLGYPGVTPSIAIEFDTYLNAADPNANPIGLVLNGAVTNHCSTYSPPWTIKNARTHAWVDVANDVIEVYVAQTNVKPASPAMTETVDVPDMPGVDFWGDSPAQPAAHGHAMPFPPSPWPMEPSTTKMATAFQTSAKTAMTTASHAAKKLATKPPVEMSTARVSTRLTTTTTASQMLVKGLKMPIIRVLPTTSTAHTAAQTSSPSRDFWTAPPRPRLRL